MKQARLAFLWHLHQPLYRLRGERSCFLPWVRLHAIRSYYDMVRVLEEFPEIRVTVNLVPVLIEQLRAYEAGASDLFLDTGAIPAEDLDEAQRAFLFDHFFSAQETQMIGDLPRYADLLARRERARRLRGPAEAWKELSTSDYRDLQALFDLAWFGFKAREDFPDLRALRERGMAYTQDNIRGIHAIEREILGRLPALYRQAAAEGRIEISASPCAHPILPLVIDSDCAKEAMPQAALPPRFRAPQDARRHVEEALDLVERELGVRPRGMWPSEGSVSHEAVELLGRCGIAWAASDEQILAASEVAGAPDPRRVWELDAPGGGTALLFRDHDLSDRIGFTYSRLPAPEAAADFTSAVRERARASSGERCLILVALDGENPWEHYPQAGALFLRALYGALSSDPDIACLPAGEAAAEAAERGRIRRLRAGSWIHADFGTWIGSPEKNRAWALLGRARADLAAALDDPRLPEPKRLAAWTSLRAAEGSDWFWWLDGQHPDPYSAQFDRIFRGHLRQAYEALDRQPVDLLAWPVSSAEARAGEREVAEPAGWLAPAIDGFEGDFFEWRGAVTLGWVSLCAPGSMQPAACPVDSLRFGFSAAGEFLLRLDPGAPAADGAFAGVELELSFRVGERAQHLRVELDGRGDLRAARLCIPAADGGDPCEQSKPSSARAAARKIFELAVDTREVGLEPGQRAGLRVRLRRPADAVPFREIGLHVPASFAGPGSAA